MAERRMFAKTIIDSDAFLDMPQSTQLLYFHLSMRADDDGFINNPKAIMRNVKCNEDDIKLLAAKKFIIPFDSGIIVIKHWKIHNYIAKDRYVETKYKEEKATLSLDENKAYTQSVYTDCIQPVYEMDTQDRIGKDRLDKDSLNYISSNEDISPSEVRDNDHKSAFKDIVALWNTLTEYGIKPIRSIVPESQRHTMLRARLKQYGSESFADIVENIKKSDFLQGKANTSRPFVATFDWVIRPNNYPKVLEGNYDNRNSGNKETELKGADVFMAIARGEI